MKKIINKKRIIFFTIITVIVLVLCLSTLNQKKYVAKQQLVLNSEGVVESTSTAKTVPVFENKEATSSPTKTTEEFATSSNQTKITQPIKTTNFTLSAGDNSISISSPIGSSLFDAMNIAKTEGKISFSEKQYPELGFYVTDIGSLHEVYGKHLLYYINGKEATVGVSLYIPQDGDIINWKLE